ncbi:hypothetical protein Nepgr_022553 [Nepenthes gracilis]|uniref:Uncharacterized protein n=1 Tax=Nepenthes gracilis TaxID=150966 RepID=A0AAD3XWX7_NEPGR|nr:hypothetical protein Nepgr_022553 [Nepenthes gracilis]
MLKAAEEPLGPLRPRMLESPYEKPPLVPPPLHRFSRDPPPVTHRWNCPQPKLQKGLTDLIDSSAARPLDGFPTPYILFAMGRPGSVEEEELGEAARR